ncbi:lipid storage droplets surface-binding protein 1 isoform X2 [Nilaparvata lugens]|uniref:lipid storage droplets surface-binding protein 1 isoform X2 n=1 Tax=Nilaparvata lugens TaxID=108931 RepID=UPI00193D86E0|nr:lipid storage droplets surface-binding protein 1 isoform X2 [Nilaparvata lugens]XP_039278302.1 lipid storage droplets surface-binding protein 1 isoform X2 [Nilaparvata lugens]
MKPNFQQDFPHLKSVNRLSKIPVVETGYNYATAIYDRLKRSNSLVSWGLTSAEAGVLLALEITLPAVSLLESPIHTVDDLLCRSLDIVEERVPAIHYPPQVIYTRTKDYVSATVVQPVLKRADSVKQISLSSATKYRELAAVRLDSALNVADKYVDKYLPDTGDNPQDATEGESKAAQTIHHVNRFSRKLQRRLTRRTIAEAKALRQQSADTLQCLIYLADLLARDPKAFMEKARTMWAHLSEDEPENQVPPANLEQLIAMLTREVARRVVHLVNFTGATVVRMPQRIGHTLHVAAHHANVLTDYLLKTVHLESMKVATVAQAKLQYVKAQEVVNQLQVFGIKLLERILSQINSSADRIHPKPQPRQISHSHSHQHSHSHKSPAVVNKKAALQIPPQNNIPAQMSNNENDSQSNNHTNSSGSKKHKKHEIKQDTPHVIEEVVN